VHSLSARSFKVRHNMHIIDDLGIRMYLAKSNVSKLQTKLNENNVNNTRDGSDKAETYKRQNLHDNFGMRNSYSVN
jgi:hypothetical protein